MMNSTYLAELVSLQKNILKVFVLTAMILSFPAFVFAQEAIELGKFLEQENTNNSSVIRSFVFDNVPTTSWKQGTLVVGSPQNAQKLITDVASLANLKEEISQNRSVKFLQINLENAAEKGQVRLNPNMLGSFANLQYVFIQSQVDLTPAEVSAMVSGYEEGDIVLLFQVVSNF
jgi:hypothetical protein